MSDDLSAYLNFQSLIFKADIKLDNPIAVRKSYIYDSLNATIIVSISFRFKNVIQNIETKVFTSVFSK